MIKSSPSQIFSDKDTAEINLLEIFGSFPISFYSDAVKSNNIFL